MAMRSWMLVVGLLGLPVVARAHSGHGATEGGGGVHQLVDHGVLVALGVLAIACVAMVRAVVRARRSAR